MEKRIVTNQLSTITIIFMAVSIPDSAKYINISYISEFSIIYKTTFAKF